MKTEVLALDVDIARQPAEWNLRDPGPEKAGCDKHGAKKNQESLHRHSQNLRCKKSFGDPSTTFDRHA
jgi:hypothetical protein